MPHHRKPRRLLIPQWHGLIAAGVVAAGLPAGWVRLRPVQGPERPSEPVADVSEPGASAVLSLERRAGSIEITHTELLRARSANHLAVRRPRMLPSQRRTVGRIMQAGANGA